MSERALRLSKEIRDVVSGLIAREIKDPRVTGNGLVTVTDVQLANDLGSATLYISVVKGDLQEVIDGLMQARGFLQKEIARRLKMKRPPRVKIASADTVKSAQHMEKLFSEIAKERATRNTAGPGDAGAGDSGGQAPSKGGHTGGSGEAT